MYPFNVVFALVVSGSRLRADNRHRMEAVDGILKRFKSFAEHNSQMVQERHAQVDTKLQTAALATTDSNTRLALQQSIASNKVSETEAEDTYRDLSKFLTSMELVVGSTATGGSGKSCADAACGLHSSCTRTTRGASCVCDEGYQGNGIHCNAPAAFIPHQLLDDGPGGRSPEARDMKVFVFNDRVAVVWRDITHSNAGYIKLGELRNNEVSFSPGERFASKAFGPTVVGWTNGRIVIAYRDSDKNGVGILRGAAIGISGVRGADKHLTWGKPITYARNLAHQSALLPISKNRFVLNFSDHKAAEAGEATSFGSTTLGSVDETGEVSVFGTFRFSEQTVTRIEATLMDDTSFVVAFRGAKLVDEMDSMKFVRQEASCVFGKVEDNDVLFYPHPLHLEPDRAQFWARSVAFVAPDIFSYAYYSSSDLDTLLVTVKVDRKLQTMTPISTKVLTTGETLFVKGLPMPYSMDPHTVTFYQPQNKLLANICSINQLGNLSACGDIEVGPAMESFDAATLPSGRLLLLFANGVPYYQVIGLAKM